MIKKEKIYELKIDEDDDISGIDSISLVDEPAIEVNWVAFNKEKQHDFHIPDGEDDSYLEQLMEYAKDEQELFDEGFEIDRIEYIKKQDFVETEPNAPSELDTKDTRVRYKYVLNPNASGPAVIPTTRQFCKELISKNYVFRIEDMLNSTNDMGQSFADWRGGYNCRHVFAKIIYRRKSEIKDNAKGKHIKGYDILGDQQNDTRTKNPSFSTAKFGKAEPIMIGGTQVFAHGEDENSANNRESGIKDSNLTENGIKYAQKLGKYLSDKPVDKIISSDVKRAKDTAKIITKTANDDRKGNKLVHYINKNLNTWNVGDFDGGNNLVFNEQEWMSKPNQVVPNGESFNSFKGRMLKAYQYVLKAPKTHQIISHSKVIRALSALHHTNGTWNEDTSKHFIENKRRKATDYHFAGTVSFDYDGVLDKLEGRLEAKRYIDNGYNVYIISKRSIGERAPVDRVAKQLGIPEKNVIFTDGRPKSDYLRKYNIQKHIDNDPDVISEINRDAPEVRTEQFDYNVGSIGGYVDPGITKKKKYSSEFDYLKTEENFKKQHFATDVDKQIVLGPAMIPNEKIFRKDDQGNPYYVFFSPETIKAIAEKYMKNKLIDNNDMMHDGEAVPDVFVMESWIIDDSKFDKSKKYGFDLPVGTWMVSMKINNPKVWADIKAKKLNGFSVSGFFEEVAAFKREEAFLMQVAEILKKIDESI